MFPTQLTTNFTTDVEQVPVTAQFQELRDEQNSIPNAWNTVEIEQFDKCDDVGTANEQEVTEKLCKSVSEINLSTTG